MSSVPVSGTEGYAEEAEALVRHYESLSFVSAAPCSVLDIGAGTGRDAASFAAMGHRGVDASRRAAASAGHAERGRRVGVSWIRVAFLDSHVIARSKATRQSRS